MDPAVLVLDEPTTGQDGDGVARVGRIVEAFRAAGRSVVAITHDMEFAATHFGRIVVMRAGQVVADGPPAAIFAAGQPGPAGLDRADAAARRAHRGAARDGSPGARRRRPAGGARALTERARWPTDRDLRHVPDAPDPRTLAVEGGPPMRILVAIDGSESANRAVDLIASIPQLDDCLVRLVSVAPNRSEILGVPWGKAIPPDAAALEASVVGVHRAALDDARREIGLGSRGPGRRDGPRPRTRCQHDRRPGA